MHCPAASRSRNAPDPPAQRSMSPATPRAGSGVGGRFLARCLFGASLLLGSATAAEEGAAEIPQVEPIEIPGLNNAHAVGPIITGGQPSPEALEALQRQRGVERVITLRPQDEPERDDEAEARRSGLEFVRIPISAPGDYTDEVFERGRRLLRQAMEKPTLIHCATANRVGPIWLAYRVLDQGVPVSQARREAAKLGLRTPQLEKPALEYIERQSQ
jgi:protein tyrosine phosphatase (PTP) superfamily phosphohydrolase (DUF442 family)